MDKKKAAQFHGQLAVLIVQVCLERCGLWGVFVRYWVWSLGGGGVFKRGVVVWFGHYWMWSPAEFVTMTTILHVQDIPFLIIAGIYTSRISLLTTPSFFSLAVSLLGITAYLVYIFRERNSIFSYCLCLKSSFKWSAKFDLQQQQQQLGDHSAGSGGGAGGGRGMNRGGMAMNGGRALNGRYVSSESEHSESDSQGTTQHVDDWMFNSNHPSGHPEHRLSIIPEHIEGVDPTSLPPAPSGDLSMTIPPPLHQRGGVGRAGMNVMVPVYMHAQDSDSEVGHMTCMTL